MLIPPGEFSESISETRGIEGVYLVIEGDWGGEINLIAPVNMVKCDQTALATLAFDLQAYGGGSIETAQQRSTAVYYSKLNVGDRYGYEKNYTEVTAGISLNKFAEYLCPYVEAILAGREEKAKTIKTKLLKEH